MDSSRMPDPSRERISALARAGDVAALRAFADALPPLERYAYERRRARAFALALEGRPDAAVAELVTAFAAPVPVEVRAADAAALRQLAAPMLEPQPHTWRRAVAWRVPRLVPAAQTGAIAAILAAAVLVPAVLLSGDELAPQIVPMPEPASHAPVIADVSETEQTRVPAVPRKARPRVTARPEQAPRQRTTVQRAAPKPRPAARAAEQPQPTRVASRPVAGPARPEAPTAEPAPAPAPTAEPIPAAAPAPVAPVLARTLAVVADQAPVADETAAPEEEPKTKGKRKDSPSNGKPKKHVPTVCDVALPAAEPAPAQPTQDLSTSAAPEPVAADAFAVALPDVATGRGRGQKKDKS
jgi:hypothetical protein